MNNKFKCDKYRNVFTSEQTLQTHKNKYHCNIKIIHYKIFKYFYF